MSTTTASLDGLGDRAIWDASHKEKEMAQFNIDAHLSSGRKLEWLAFADEGESLKDVCSKVREAAGKKFGPAVRLKRWTIIRATNGCITVTMHA